MIGPLSDMTGVQLKKLEHFAENQIPGVTESMIGYHGKFHIDDNFFPFGANNGNIIEEEEEELSAEEKSQKQEKEQHATNSGDKMHLQEQDVKEEGGKDDKDQHTENNGNTKEQQEQSASDNSHMHDKQQQSEIVNQQPVSVLLANNEPVAVIMEYINQQPPTDLNQQKEEWWA